MPFDVVHADWPAACVFIVAGGPSLAGTDLSVLRGNRVIAVNSSYLAVPFADVLFFGDGRWWREHQGRLEGFGGRIVTISQAAAAPAGRLLRLKKVKPPPGLTDQRASLVMNYTSLHGAINLAVHLGAARLVLLGADMQPAPDGRTHHHAPHPWPQKPGCWDLQMAELQTARLPLERLGIPVVNTSLESRIAWWPKRPLAAVLAEEGIIAA